MLHTFSLTRIQSLCFDRNMSGTGHLETGTLANSEDPDEMRQCCISSGSALFAKIKTNRFTAEMHHNLVIP